MSDPSSDPSGDATVDAPNDGPVDLPVELPVDTVVLRRIGPDDAGAMRSMIVAIQREELGFDINLDDQPDLAAQDLFDDGGFYGSGNGGFWVAVDGAQVVGSIALRDCGNRVGALRKMFVDASHRGPRSSGRPIAAELLDALVGHARASGFERIVLGTTDRFAAAHRFYEKHGFERIEQHQLPEGFPRMAVDTRFYAMALGGHPSRTSSSPPSVISSRPE